MPYIRDMTRRDVDVLELNQIPYEVEVNETLDVKVPREHLAKALYVLNKFAFDERPLQRTAS